MIISARDTSAATLKYDIYGTQSWWVSPDYKLFKVPDNVEHEEYIMRLDKKYNDLAYKKLNSPSKNQTSVMEEAIKDGWSRIGYWPHGMKGSWLEMDLGKGTNLDKIILLMNNEPIHPDTVVSPSVSFDVGEDQTIMEAYESYKRRKHL